MNYIGKHRLIYLILVSFISSLIVSSCAFAYNTSVNDNLKVGVSKIDITPPIGYKVHNKISDGVFDSLYVKSIVLNQGDTKVAFVLVDLFYMPLDLSETVRKIASQKTKIPIENICVAATHTHADPTCYEEIIDYVHRLNSKSLTDKDNNTYAVQIIESIVNSIMVANSKLQSTSLSTGVINVDSVAFNRRHLMRDGQVVMNGGFLNTDIIRAVGPVDQELGVILFTDKVNNSPIASFSTFGMQLATVGGTTKFSGDYPHFIEKKLKNEFGENFISVFGEGPSGDVNHWDITKSGPQIGYKTATEQVGNKLGEAMLKGIPNLIKTKASLSVLSQVINIPLQTYSNMDLNWAKSFSDSNASQIVKSRVRKILKLEELREKYGDSLPMEIQVFRLSESTAVVALPGQLFVELGIAIKEASPFDTTIIITLANSHEETIPLRKAYSEGSYEVVYSLVESGGGELMVEAALKMLNELKN